MFRFSILCVTSKVFKPRLIVSNTGLLETLKFRTQRWNNNLNPRLLSRIDISKVFRVENSEEQYKNSLITKSALEMLDLAEDVEDLQSASIYIGYLCQKLSISKDLNFIELVITDERLNNVFSYFAFDNEKVERVPDTFVLNLLFSLYKLNSFHSPLVTATETCIISRLDKLNERDLLRILEIYSKKKVSFKFTTSSLLLFNKTVNKVLEKCKEFENPNHLISAAYYFVSLQMPDAVKNITPFLQSNDSVSRFNAKQLCSILFLLASYVDIKMTTVQRRKIVDLLNEFDLNVLNVKMLNKLLYSCGVFNIYDADLLKNVSSALKRNYSQQKKDFGNADVQHTLASLGSLRWKDSELLELTLNLIEPSSFLNSQPIVSALAFLDYRIPENLKIWIKQFPETDILLPLKTLDIVWSMVVLNIADAKHIASVINPKFIASVCSNLSYSESGYKYSNVVKIQKLQNISLAGKLDFNIPPEAMLMESYIFDLQRMCHFNSNSEALLSALSKISGSNCIDSETVIGGHFIDALLYVNSDGYIEKLENTTPEKFDKYHRICIKIQGFHDTLLNEVGPTGQFKMSIRHLTRLGFKVIVVPYQLFSSMDSEEIPKYIQDNINEIVNCDS